VCTEIVSAGSTALHLSAIAIDRYLAIMHPIVYKNFGRGYVRLSVTVTWGLSFAIMTPTVALNWLRYWTDEDGRDQCEIPQVRGDSFLLLVECAIDRERAALYCRW
jgi:hypothetical protein